MKWTCDASVSAIVMTCHTFLCFSLPQQQSPLSSSLLTDWMEVTGSLNIDMEALEQELGLQSPMSLSYNDLSLYQSWSSVLPLVDCRCQQCILLMLAHIVCVSFLSINCWQVRYHNIMKLLYIYLFILVLDIKDRLYNTAIKQCRWVIRITMSIVHLFICPSICPSIQHSFLGHKFYKKKYQRL